jgi:hypothetical protein
VTAGWLRRRHRGRLVLGGKVAEPVEGDPFLNGAVADPSVKTKLSNDEVMVWVDGDILLVDGDVVLNVAVADRMNGQNLSIDTVPDRIVAVADLIND